MGKRKDDYHDLLEQQRFLEKIERGIRVANREIIHKLIPSVNKETILAFAVAIGRLRARYLKAAFDLGVNENGEAPERAEVEELKTRREMYEEARSAFEALREAVERGYLDVGDLEG